jgi:hypothetical protein
MLANRFSLVGCVLLALAGCQPVPPQTFPYRQLDTAHNRSKEAPLIRATDDPQIIVEKVIQAYGGAEKCGWRTGRVKFHATFKEFEGEVEDWFQLPGKFKRVIWTAKGVTENPVMSLVYNGDRLWVTGRNKSAVQLPAGPETNPTEHFLGLTCNPLHLRDEGRKLKILGEEMVHDRKTVAVNVETPSQSRRLYLDESSGLVLRIRARLPKSLSKNEAETETDFSEYRDFQGAKVPTRMTSRSEGKVVLDTTIMELESLDKIDDSVFAKP